MGWKLFSLELTPITCSDLNVYSEGYESSFKYDSPFYSRKFSLNLKFLPLPLLPDPSHFMGWKIFPL